MACIRTLGGLNLPLKALLKISPLLQTGKEAGLETEAQGPMNELDICY